MNSTRLALAAILASLAGCNPFAPKCTEQRRVVEVEYGSALYEFERDAITNYEKAGYTCASDGAIRNAFGVAIGTRYVCTKCD